MKKRYIFLGILYFALVVALQAQDQFERYKFIKKTGGTIIGEIVEKTADGPYKILLDNGVTIELKEQQIYRMKPLKTGTGTGLLYAEQFSPPSYKWAFNTEMMGISNSLRNIGTPDIAAGLAFSVQRYFGPQLAAGAGTGMYNYDLNARRLLIPVFADLKWRMIKNFSTPVIQFKTGYGLATNNFINGLVDKRGGMFYNPFFGYEFGVHKKVSWTMGLGVILQKAYYAYRDGSTFEDEDILFRRTEFKIAISIH